MPEKPFAKKVTLLVKTDEFEFAQKLAKYDNISVYTELSNLLSLQIREEMELEEQIQRGEQ